MSSPPAGSGAHQGSLGSVLLHVVTAPTPVGERRAALFGGDIIGPGAYSTLTY